MLNVLEKCKYILEKLLSIKEEAKDIEIKLSAPEILADKKLVKYYSYALSQYTTVLSRIEDLEIALECKDIDQINRILSALIFALAYVKKSSSAMLEIDSSDVLFNFYLKFLKENNIDFIEKDNAITINAIGAYEIFNKFSGLYLVNGQKKYIYVTTKEDIKFNFNEDKIKIDIFRASKKGGQKVNKTETAIRATYLDTKDVVICQDERSQLQNKERAIERLKELVEKRYIESIAKDIKQAKDIIKKQNNEIMQLDKDSSYEEFVANLLIRTIDANN